MAVQKMQKVLYLANSHNLILNGPNSMIFCYSESLEGALSDRMLKSQI